MKPTSPLCALLLATPLVAQSNAIPGHDIDVYSVSDAAFYGRTGPAYPNGVATMVIGHSMSNCGSNHIPWDGVVGSVMQDEHVKIAFMVARENADGGRMVQISGKSYCKHSRVAFNFSGSPPCFPCQSGPSNHFRIGCYDVYSTGFNGSQYTLGPTTEINPWLGTWNPTGSYFDIGDPGQSNFPQPADNVQSLDTLGFDFSKNRMSVPEQELVKPGTFYGQNQVVIIGEPVDNRANNLVSRPINVNWNGSSWSESLGGSNEHGSVLTRWTGATTSMARNGNDDGNFLIAVKVTGPTNGMWHYEYAVHNIDNDRGAATVRIPMCGDARVENIGFHDIDQDGLNDWTSNRTSTELEFLAAADNPIDWNTIYNFWFDSDAAPSAGDINVDQARPGPGALTVQVPTTVPGLLPTQYLGDGCGVTVPKIYANGLPTSPNPNFAIEIEGDPSTPVLVAVSTGAANLAVGGGCTQWIDGAGLLVAGLYTTDASGLASAALPLPAGLNPGDFSLQGFELASNGALLGFLDLTNGITLRIGATSCP